ncbi:MAG: ABC transporter substrate-binding protein [Rhodoferax sp.]|nr:ABC transporter substrate-binding protein [Rhodoferax sp.]MDP3651970.1 ABC transporter substrate-binding protein [Rhodoferax sp.]
MIHRRQLIASIAGLGLSQWATAQSDKPIVLGQSAPFSGPSEILGSQYNQGARLYFEAVNTKGGVNGRPIELKRLDDALNPERCVANTRQFIGEGVFALFGYVGTPSSMAALPLATEAKVPFFAPLTGAQSLREPFNRYAIHVRASYFEETAAIIKQMTAVGIKKIAVFHQNDAFGKAGLEDVIHALAPLNLKPVAAGSVETNSTDVAQALKSILGAGPEAIIQIGAYKGCATFVRLARRAGYGGNFYNISFVDTQALSAELGAVARGVIVSQVMPFPYGAATPIATEYLSALQASGLVATSPNYSGIEGFVAAKVFTEALRRAGKALTREGFLTAIQSMHNYNLGGMTMEFGPQKNVGSKFVEMTMLTEDGKVRH